MATNYFPPAARKTAAWAMAAVLAGCTVGPDYKQSAAPDDARFTEKPMPVQTVSARTVGGAAQTLHDGQDIPGEWNSVWWTLFHSPRIEALVTQALQANPDLTAAQATLREARENMRAEQGAFFPSVSASASGTRERISPYSLGEPGGTSPPFTLYDPSLSLSYTLDVFGGIRRQVEQLGAQVDYQRFELEATYLNLTSNVVNAACRRRSTPHRTSSASTSNP
jgi:outer membrane protein TolC